MARMNSVVAIAAGLYLLSVAVADLRSRKISNTHNVGAATVAFVLQFLTGGIGGASTAALGFLAGFLVLLFPFACGLLGGGDVKFSAAAGAFLGWRILLIGLAGGIILGGVVGMVSLLSQRRMLIAMKSLWADLYSIAAGVRPTTLQQAATVKTIPYGVMLAIGIAGAMAAHTWRLI